MGYTSITFPALGTGNLGYPPELVAKTMLDCFVNYATTQRNTPITEIVIVTGIRETGPVYTVRLPILSVDINYVFSQPHLGETLFYP